MSSAPDAPTRQPSGRMARLMLIIFWPMAVFPAILIGGLVYLYGYRAAAVVPASALAIVGLASLVIFAFSGALIRLAAVRITAPLVSLANVMTAYQEGRRDWRAPLERSTDESGDLARLFNQLADENQELARRASAADSNPNLKLTAWLQLSQAINTATDLQSLVKLALDGLRLTTAYNEFSIYLIEQDPASTPARAICRRIAPEPTAGSAQAAPGRNNGAAIQAEPAEAAEDASGAASAILLDPVAHENGSRPWLFCQAASGYQPVVMRLAEAAPEGGRLLAAIPISFAGQPTGVLEVGAPSPAGNAAGMPGSRSSPGAGPFSSRALADLQAMANLLAPALAYYHPGQAIASPGKAADPGPEGAAPEAAAGSAGQVIGGLEREAAELRLLWNVSQAVAGRTDPTGLYETIHAQIESLMGAVSSFAIALYDAENETIAIPYMSEEGKLLEIPPFPLGEGLTSVLIRRRQPLLLVENVEEQIKQLGAKTIGPPARSWLGVPLLVAGEPTGAIIVQDIHHERRFNEQDERLLVTLASQLAVFIRNSQLLEASQRQARLERLVNEITAQVSRSVDMHEILAITTSQLGAALGAQSAYARITPFAGAGGGSAANGGAGDPSQASAPAGETRP